MKNLATALKRTSSVERLQWKRSCFVNCLNKHRLTQVSPSRVEYEVSAQLDKLGLMYFYDARIQNFVGQSGLQHLRFDFIVMEKNRIQFIIECQGAFHYEVVPGKNTHKELRRQQVNDELKRAYCFGAGIDLVEIPYWARPGKCIAETLARYRR